MQGLPRAHLNFSSFSNVFADECFFISVFCGKHFLWSERAEF